MPNTSSLSLSVAQKARLAKTLLRRSEPLTESGCWIFTGAVNNHGYGLIGVSHAIVKLAHRVAYVVWKSPLSAGQCVCHTCDTPCCINPAHLWVGSHTQNMRDMCKKNRHHSNAPRGERSWSHKLTADMVLEIRSALRNGAVGRRLAEKYRVGFTTISAIKRGQNWGHLT